ncbi:MULTISPECIES: type I DNA topoisomerase [unclassified Gemella]|uniref:type I DNA topoisomerase n=1 Tax=unclassified Gemella TaxID=2624949 RepID=UPI00107485EB|nr:MULTISPECIES: type I DNA topoisomerase [unclassified Gemella]MBF0710007.1 type I DNA topoisomerase [Gemella sp. GL1.1]MBF0746086.1 type I DNA topoisomerase [Gemella sp. 19428wG2_WT2a]NYS27351.1 type I DNA topoisomerase [Gemella sp. GL1]TFU60377.1 type I DNA topoisomerase [Gemella sp. WT2a]
MAENLVIVESPSKAKTIEKYLGKKYKVLSSKGHIKDLPKSRMGVEVVDKDNIQADYISIRGKGDLIKSLKKEAKGMKNIYLASDPDREGEAIAWHIASILNLENGKNRVIFNEITKDAVKEAIKSPREIDSNLVDSQQARRVLDRLVGYNISPVLWKKVKPKLSAGRVQSASLKLIVDRENEIRSFIPEEYWTIPIDFIKDRRILTANFYSYKGEKVKLQTKKDVDVILKGIKGNTFDVIEVNKSNKNRTSPLVYTTSTMQQDASRKINFKTRKTMSVAQELYEGVNLKKLGGITGLITYMRTDSTRISEEAKKQAYAYIVDQFGEEYVATVAKKIKGNKNVQDAHEGIRPTNVNFSPNLVKDYLTPDQLKLYTLIWNRFVASQMAAAVYETRTTTFENNQIVYKASDSKIIFDGFLKVLKEKEKVKVSASFEKGDAAKYKEIKEEQHFTHPPARYSEAKLIASLEELGIGRPSTYSSIIETLQKRYYAKLNNKVFTPTELGEIVSNMIAEYFPNIINVEFTAKLESDLDKIAEGNIKWQHAIYDFYSNFEKDVVKAEKELEKVEIQKEYTGEDCPECSSPLLYKLGKFGKFVACSNFPDCRYTETIQKKVGVTCPSCKKHEILEKKSKKGKVFYGCEDFPNCEFVSWDKPINRQCPKCQNILYENKKHVFCASCDYKEK